MNVAEQSCVSMGARRASLSHALASTRICRLRRERPTSVVQPRRSSTKVVSGLGFVSEAFSAAKSTHPYLTAAFTSGTIYATGDIISQRRSSPLGSQLLQTLDTGRLRRFALVGLGAGVLWDLWYTSIDGWFDAHQFNEGTAVRTTLAIVLEQVLWAPLFYGLYLIPLSDALTGKGTDELARDVRAELPKTLVSSAKVWTLANAFLYNCPLEYRVLASNCVDLFWALLLSQSVAECNEDLEECLVSKPDLSYMEGLRVTIAEPESKADTRSETELATAKPVESQ